MAYNKNIDLPESVKDNLPEHAQDIYREAYNAAWEEYEDKKDRRQDRSQEETAHAVAWSAVKDVYEKDKDGKWKKKGE